MTWWIIGGIVIVLVAFSFYRYVRDRVKAYYHPSILGWGKVPHEVVKDSCSIFLIGDSGAPVLTGKDSVLQLLKAKLREKGRNGVVVFLGDNIYPRGLPPEGQHQRLMRYLLHLRRWHRSRSTGTASASSTAALPRRESLS